MKIIEGEKGLLICQCIYSIAVSASTSTGEGRVLVFNCTQVYILWAYWRMGWFVGSYWCRKMRVRTRSVQVVHPFLYILIVHAMLAKHLRFFSFFYFLSNPEYTHVLKKNISTILQSFNQLYLNNFQDTFQFHFFFVTIEYSNLLKILFYKFLLNILLSMKL